MTDEERIDLNDRRLNDHAVRVAKLEEQMSNCSDDIECHRQETRLGFTEIKSEIRTYFGPVKQLTEKHDRSILSLEKDMGWIKPWFKRLALGGVSMAAVGIAIQLFLDHGPK